MVDGPPAVIRQLPSFPFHEQNECGREAEIGKFRRGPSSRKLGRFHSGHSPLSCFLGSGTLTFVLLALLEHTQFATGHRRCVWHRRFTDPLQVNTHKKLLCTVPGGGRLVGEELVAHGEAEVVVEPLVAVVEVVEADGRRHGGALADEHRAGRARVHRAAELPAAAAEMPVGDLEVAVGAAAVVVRLEPAQLELLERELQGMNGRHREKLLVGLL